MHPSDAADEIRRHNLHIPDHRLAELLSVIDGELWSPDDAAGLHDRLRDYMTVNQVPPAAAPDPAYLARVRNA
jgi:hypothetical protein